MSQTVKPVHLIVLSLAWLPLACGGGAGHGAEADGPPPSGKGTERGLVLVEGEPEADPAAQTPPGDGTTTPEIVKSVEKDQP